MSAVPRPRMTVAEYLALSAESPERLEFYNGEPVAMAGGSPAHALVIANTTVALAPRLRGSPCRVYSADLRVHVATTDAWVYPDVTVVCGPADLHPTTPPSLLNPRLVVEVLSPSTAAHDRGAKAAHYRRMPSLAAYLLIDPDARRAELYYRGDDGEWRLREAEGDGTIEVPSPAITLHLAELWEGLDA